MHAILKAWFAKVCALSRQQGEEHSLLRAASLQCLSAMVMYSSLFMLLFPTIPSKCFSNNFVLTLSLLTIIIFVQIWFMKEHSYIFADFDEVVTVIFFYSIYPVIIA